MSKSKPLTPNERKAMIEQKRFERQERTMAEAKAFLTTPEGMMLVALGEYLEELGFQSYGYKFDGRLVATSWSYYPSENIGPRASVSVVPASEPSACEVQVFRTSGRSLYAITTPSPAETLRRLQEFIVFGVPVVEWAKAEEVKP